MNVIPQQTWPLNEFDPSTDKHDPSTALNESLTECVQASIGRRLWVNYKFTDKRLIITNTSPLFARQVCLYFIALGVFVYFALKVFDLGMFASGGVFVRHVCI
jgi:hypothetical protein